MRTPALHEIVKPCYVGQLFIFSHYKSLYNYITAFYIFIFLVANNFEHIFTFLFAIHTFSLENYLFKICAHYLLGFCWVLAILYMYCMQVFNQIQFVNIFSQLVACLVILLTVSFKEQWFLMGWNQIHQLVFFFGWSFGLLSKISLFNLKSQKFSPRVFLVSGFKFRSMIHFELTFTYGSKYRLKVFVLFCFCTRIVPIPLIERLYFFTQLLLHRCQKSVVPICMGLFFRLCSILHTLFPVSSVCLDTSTTSWLL